jgi:hypothetical protein
MLKKNDLVYIKKSILDTCRERKWYGNSLASSWIGQISKITGRRKHTNRTSTCITYLTASTNIGSYSLLEKDLIKLDFVKCLIADPIKFFFHSQIANIRGEEVYLLNLINSGEMCIYHRNTKHFVPLIYIRKLLQDNIIVPVSKSRKKIKVFIEEKEII